MQRTNWFERGFPPITDNGLLPGIIERLEGTPVRLAEKVKNFTQDFNPQSADGKWSLKKEIGHLADIESLWFERLQQIIAADQDMKVADLTNRKTHEAPHDSKNFEELIAEFRPLRAKFVAALRALGEEDLEKTSLHPRLKTPMKVIDLAFFVAEHDDHHLAQVSALVMH